MGPCHRGGTFEFSTGNILIAWIILRDYFKYSLCVGVCQGVRLNALPHIKCYRGKIKSDSLTHK